MRLGNGRVSYDDPLQDTSIVAEISTQPLTSALAKAGSADGGIAFKASGKYLGLALAAGGNGGPVLGLRDERTPFPLALAEHRGPDGLPDRGHDRRRSRPRRAVSAKRMSHCAAESLAELYNLFAIPLPETRDYAFGRASHLRYR